MSVDKISKLINSVANTLENNEKIALPLFSTKLQKFAEEYPHDATIVSMSSIVKKLAHKQSCITRGEIRDLYKRLYSRNTKFANFFAEELKVTAKEESKNAINNLNPDIDIHSEADSILSNALESVFDKNAKVKMYSKIAASKAVDVVSNMLDVWGVKASKVEVEDGNENFIVIKASYDTPKGVTSFYVPVETNENKVTNPELFVANNGPNNINNVNITSYIKSFAGQKLTINSQKIIEKLASLKNNDPEVNNIEMAIIRLNASRGNGEMFANQILNQEFDQPSIQDVKLAELHDPEALTFAQRLESPAGIASFKFGNDKVNTGREFIFRSLNEFGSPQIVVADSNDNTIIYGVSLNNGRVAFKVPVKIENNKVYNPQIMISNGSVSQFNSNNINKLIASNSTDYATAAITSPLRNMKSTQLVEVIKESLADNNYLKAEDALNVLSTMNDPSSYNMALSYIMNNMGMKKEAAQESKCSMVVRASNSQHHVCGHTGLPLHKVYQDEYGNCAPLYRKAIDKPYEGAFFMNSKIFG